MDYKQLYEKFKTKYEKCWEKLSNAEETLYDADYRQCPHCNGWTKDYTRCNRCWDHYCEEECLDNPLVKCIKCQEEVCAKCCVYPPAIPDIDHWCGTTNCQLDPVMTPYTCHQCIKIDIWIPNNYNKLPIYYKNNILYGLMAMKRIISIPKYIRFLILNYIFEGKNTYSDLATRYCQHVFGSRKECQLPIFNNIDKYCVGCLKRKEVRSCLKRQND